MGHDMLRLGIFSLAALVAVAGVAAAQSFGGRTRGNDHQQAHNQGYATVRKKEEKKFPLGSSWIAVSLDGKTFSGTERPAFSVDEMFRVRGFGGCNNFSATAFPMREQGIAVGPLALTRNACDKALMALETSFLTALRSSAKWDTQIGSLIIKGPSGEIKFERAL